MKSVLLALLLVGCAKKTETLPPPRMPAAAEAVRPAMLARDTDDLPQIEDLGPTASEGLQWLAEFDEMLVVRQRALATLAFFQSDEVMELCLAALHVDNTPQERTGAATCLGGQDWSDDSPVFDALQHAATDSDTRVADAAREALGDDSALTEPQ